MRTEEKDILVELTINGKNTKIREIIEILKEEAVFLITALSLTGFFAHYVGITVYSI